MELNTLKPSFRYVARCVTYLALLAGIAVILAFAAIDIPLMSDVFNPHATGGALVLLGLFALALLDFLALMYFVPRAAVELYRRPGTRTAPHWITVASGVIALALVGAWLHWFSQR